MSQIQLKVLPSFPAQVIGVDPIIIEKDGLTYEISFGGIVVTQVKTHITNLGFYDLVAAAIPGAPSNPVRQAWDSGGITQVDGPLMTNIYATLGLVTQTAKDAFVTVAKLLPY